MHYSNIVIIESSPDRSVNDAVAAAMEFGKDSWWDFWQIGGRWTGFFDGYDPDSDESLKEVCHLCNGSGTRKDMAIANGCNGCGGKGKSTMWPTKWPTRNGDIVPVSALTEEHLTEAFRVICEGYTQEFGGEEYRPWIEHGKGEMFVKRDKPPLDWLKKEFANYLAVIVDNHD